MDGLRLRSPTMRILEGKFALSRSSFSFTPQVIQFGRVHSGTLLRRCLRDPPEPRRYVSIFAQNNYEPKSALAERKPEDNHGDMFSAKGEQPSPGSSIAVDKPLPRSQSTVAKSGSMTLILGGAVLALGFGLLRFCKPAFAESIAAPPIVSAVLNDNGEVEVRESTLSEAKPHELNDEVVSNGGMETQEQLGSNENAGEGFEPPFGEGSDLTNDPAEVVLRGYLEMHPADKNALQALLFLRLKKGEVNASLPVLMKLIELEPDNLEWKYIKAQADEYSGDLPQARQGYEEILQSKPLSARAWQGLTVVLHKAGEDEEALQLLVEAVQQAVDAGQTKEALNLRMLLGQLHTMQGDLEKAMEQYKIVVQEDPTDYRPYLCQGLVYSIIGQEIEAEKYFKRYRKLCPKDFPQRGFLDELLLNAKTESQKLNKRIKQDEELRMKGKKRPKDMRQPLASGNVPFKDDPARGAPSKDDSKAPE